jgi:hypothetical protein
MAPMAALNKQPLLTLRGNLNALDKMIAALFDRGKIRSVKIMLLRNSAQRRFYPQDSGINTYKWIESRRGTHLEDAKSMFGALKQISTDVDRDQDLGSIELSNAFHFHVSPSAGVQHK